MVEHLPEWVMRRYSKLWLKFKDKDFIKSDAEKVLSNDSSLAVLLSDLKKAGWLEMKMSEKDGRKTIYKLKNPIDTITELIKEFGKK